MGGLPRNCDETALARAFAKFGRVKDCVVMKDHETGESRGFGFLIFETAEIIDVILSQGKRHKIGINNVDCRRSSRGFGGDWTWKQDHPISREERGNIGQPSRAARNHVSQTSPGEKRRKAGDVDGDTARDEKKAGTAALNGRAAAKIAKATTLTWVVKEASALDGEMHHSDNWIGTVIMLIASIATMMAIFWWRDRPKARVARKKVESEREDSSRAPTVEILQVGSTIDDVDRRTVAELRTGSATGVALQPTAAECSEERPPIGEILQVRSATDVALQLTEAELRLRDGGTETHSR